MSGRTRRLRHPRMRSAATALTITLAIQVFTALAAAATSVLAPEIGRDLGIAPKLIGVFVGLMFGGAMAASLTCGGLIERYGAIRVSQLGAVLCATGLIVMVVVATWRDALLPLLVMAPLVIGLGYGPINPASSQLLARTTPRSRMALTFSIKQTGVPAGAALAGALLPVVAVRLGWHAAFALVASMGVVIAAAAQTLRAEFDVHRNPVHRLSAAGVIAPLLRVLRTPALRELVLAGFVLAALQICVVSFLVIYLTETIGRSLIAAGFALTATNLGGMVGRIALGFIADRFMPPRIVMGLVGLGSGVCAWLTAAFEPGWSSAAIVVVCVLLGTTAIGWTGVQLSELARHAPAGEEGATTGASGFITLGGVVVGPPTFAFIAALTGGYRTGFAVFGALGVACGVWLLLRHRK